MASKKKTAHNRIFKKVAGTTAKPEPGARDF
jgi:hypothetical protein